MTSTSDDIIKVSSDWPNLLELVGKPFQGDWFTVEPERLHLFDTASYTSDNEHVLASGIYPAGLIEGFHMLSLLDHLVNKVVFIDHPNWSGWNYGLDSVRFVSIVTAKDRFRIKGSIASIEPRAHRYLVTFNCTIEVEGREKPGMVAVWKVLWTLDSEEK